MHEFTLFQCALPTTTTHSQNLDIVHLFGDYGTYIMERIVRIDGYSLPISKSTKLGQGLVSKVYLGEQITSKNPVAVKVIDYPDDGEFVKYLRGEVEILRSVKHDNIIKLFHHTWADNALLLFLEYCPLGDLSQYLRNNPKPDDTELLSYFLDCANALDFLHHSSIMHRDLKPQNILVTDYKESKRLKLTDFGFSKITDQNVSSFVGTYDYIAPEMWKLVEGRRQYGFPSDIFSLGVVMEAMIAHEPPSSVQPLRGEYIFFTISYITHR